MEPVHLKKRQDGNEEDHTYGSRAMASRMEPAHLEKHVGNKVIS
jgi:hypothetical protein